jgi:hypothetical protein
LPKSQHNYFHHPRLERRVYLAGTILTPVIGLSSLILLWNDFLLLGIALFLLLLGFGVLFGRTWLRAQVRVGLSEHGLSFFTPRKSWRVPFDSITDWEWNPSSGRILLYQGDKVNRLEQRLRGFYYLRDLLVPHLEGFAFQPKELPFTFKIIRTAFVIYGVFIAAVALFTVLWWQRIQDLMGTPGLILLLAFSIALILTLLIRVLFLLPSAYVFYQDKIKVLYLLRSLEYHREDIRKYREDHYAKGGIIYYLLRIQFPDRHFVLDEMYLDKSLWRMKYWLKDHFLPRR